MTDTALVDLRALIELLLAVRREDAELGPLAADQFGDLISITAQPPTLDGEIHVDVDAERLVDAIDALVALVAGHEAGGTTEVLRRTLTHLEEVES